MLKSITIFLGLICLSACSDDASIERQDNTRDNNGGVIITTDIAADTGTDSENDSKYDSYCGNASIDEGEVCDDGNQDSDDYCSADCRQMNGSCGDGIVQSNEVCDGDTCTADCQAIRTSDCGNGDLNAGEVCDDGNLMAGDYCSEDCSQETGSCGDGRVQDNEVCDDGNQSADDYCSADCLLETGSCGDGVVQTNENCDDQTTADCLNTHDGGDATCVPANTCSTGYMLNGNGVCISTNTTGLWTACSQGAGYAMFKIHYDSGSTSARVDVWDANCSYSFASNSACNVREVCRGFCDVPRTGGGSPIFNTSNYWRARFNANGLNFTNATLWVRAVGTRGSTVFRAWSPLYGDVVSGLVSGFTYDWYAVDWSNHLSPFDQPSLTAIQIYGMNGPIAVQAVELCVN